MPRIGCMSLLLILLWASGCASPRRTAPPPYDIDAWRLGSTPGFRVTTEHYTIYTTVGDENLVRTFPVIVEAAHEFYEEQIPPVSGAQHRLETFLLQTRGQWLAVTRKLFPPERARQLEIVRNGGYAEGERAVIQYVSHAVTFPLLAHEGFHQYVAAALPSPLPVWLNEGLAVCAEGQRWRGNFDVQFEPDYNPLRRNALAQRLRGAQLIPLRTLLRTHPGEVAAGRYGDISAYYAQVWALVLFLQSETAPAEYRAGYARLIAAVRAPNAEKYAKAAFIAATDDDYNYSAYLFRNFITHELDAFETAYHSYIRNELVSTR